MGKVIKKRQKPIALSSADQAFQRMPADWNAAVNAVLPRGYFSVSFIPFFHKDMKSTHSVMENEVLEGNKKSFTREASCKCLLCFSGPGKIGFR